MPSAQPAGYPGSAGINAMPSILQTAEGQAPRSPHCKRTSLGDLCKGQACAPLEIDIVGVDEGAEGPEGLAGEEVGFATLFISQ